MSDTPVRPEVGMISMMSRDPRRLASFWSELMGLPIAEGASDDVVMLDFDHKIGPITWIIEHCDEVAVGTAPIALDLGGLAEADWRGVADLAQTLGAARVDECEHEGVRWIELLDPDGNRFRVFAPRPDPDGSRFARTRNS